MTNQYDTSLSGVNIEDFQCTCENHEQLTLALCSMIEVGASPEAIRLIANQVREQADLILSQSRFLAVSLPRSVAHAA